MTDEEEPGPGTFYHQNPDALPPTEDELEDIYGGQLYASWRDQFWERYVDLPLRRAELIGKTLLFWLLIALVIVAIVKGDIG